MFMIYDTLEAEYILSDPADEASPYSDAREWEWLEHGCYRHLALQAGPTV